MTMEDVLKKAIRDSGRTLNGIADEAGVSRGSMSLLMSGKRTMTLPVADRICRVLGLELKQVGRKAR